MAETRDSNKNATRAYPSTCSVHQISRLPIDLNPRVSEHYPKMKMGCQESARYLAGELAPLAASIIETYPAIHSWVLTSPPLSNIRAGANYMCRYIHERLAGSLPSSRELALIELALEGGNAAVDHFRNTVEYSQLTQEERLAARKAERRPVLHDRDFRGRGVLYINDICVTGSQQRIMRDYLATTSPAAVHWLYLVKVDEALGQEQPQLENQLNRNSYTSADDLTELLRRDDIEYTGRCLSRLLAFPVDDLARILPALGVNKVTRILSLARINGCWGSQTLRAPLQLLTEFCQRAGRSPDRTVDQADGGDGI